MVFGEGIGCAVAEIESGGMSSLGHGARMRPACLCEFGHLAATTSIRARAIPFVRALSMMSRPRCLQAFRPTLVSSRLPEESGRAHFRRWFGEGNNQTQVHGAGSQSAPSCR